MNFLGEDFSEVGRQVFPQPSSLGLTHAFTPMGNLASPIYQNPRRHRENMQTRHRKPRFKPGTFSLWGNSTTHWAPVLEYMQANNRSTVFGCCFYFFVTNAFVHLLLITVFVLYVSVCSPTMKVQGPVGSDRGRYCMSFFLSCLLSCFLTEFNWNSCSPFSPPLHGELAWPEN